VVLNPRSEQAWFKRGVALLCLKRHDEALVSFERALTLNAGNNQAWFNKGLALLRLNRIEESNKRLRRGFTAGQARSEPGAKRNTLCAGKVRGVLVALRQGAGAGTRSVDVAAAEGAWHWAN
jgi:tetratricopeptide (TPR) repeat protein